MRARAACAAVLALSAAIASPAAVRADEPETVAMARAAYDRGAKAYNLGQYALAAREFTVADELAPNPVALRLALQAALRLDDPVLGMKLVERAEGRGSARELASAVAEARTRFSRRVGRITFACPGAPTCRARIDGELATGSAWVTPGAHAIEWESGARQSARVDAGEKIEIGAPGTGPAAGAGAGPSAGANPGAGPNPGPSLASDRSPNPERNPGGVSPTWFWVGVAVTTIAGAATVGSGLDTLHRHDVFHANPTAANQSDGRAAQLRTNVFLGATLASALATALLGVFVVRWSADKIEAHVEVRPLVPSLL